VKLVLNIEIIVQLVHVTELIMITLVSVLKVTLIIMKKEELKKHVVDLVNSRVLHVHNVLLAVIPVTKVVQKEAQFLNAKLFHKVSTLLILKISQSDLLESLIVTVNVTPVLKLPLTV
jgi:hypothetical protein